MLIISIFYRSLAELANAWIKLCMKFYDMTNYEMGNLLNKADNRYMSIAVIWPYSLVSSSKGILAMRDFAEYFDIIFSSFSRFWSRFTIYR